MGCFSDKTPHNLLKHTFNKGGIMKKIKVFQKLVKGFLPILWLITGWVVLWNVIYQILAANGLVQFGSIKIVTWAFFLTITVFFMQEELSNKDRFFTTLFGGAVGILLGWGVISGTKALAGTGLNPTFALCIFLAIAITMLIMLHPFMPYFFNNVGFCYFVIYFVFMEIPEEELAEISVIPSLLISLALGSIIMNLGCMLLLRIYKNCRKNSAR